MTNITYRYLMLNLGNKIVVKAKWDVNSRNLCGQPSE